MTLTEYKKMQRSLDRVPCGSYILGRKGRRYTEVVKHEEGNYACFSVWENGRDCFATGYRLDQFKPFLVD